MRTTLDHRLMVDRRTWLLRMVVPVRSQFELIVSSNVRDANLERSRL